MGPWLERPRQRGRFALVVEIASEKWCCWSPDARQSEASMLLSAVAAAAAAFAAGPKTTDIKLRILRESCLELTSPWGDVLLSPQGAFF